uniref:Uncharacterized protein n=1 Tax=Pithovirus LCPAC404 TaxID=2506597 RepID=A0A481ZCQ2_9VIRU|nr:MAG: uncharacterized protein LCPAC404_02610 [Pithovirus LCPAC404]
MSVQSRTPPEKRFQTNVLALADFILNLKSQDLSDVDIKLVKIYITGANCNTTIKTFIMYSRPLWKNISEQDETYFVDHAKELFCMFPQNNINIIINVLSGDNANKNTKAVIWKYFESLVKISIHWILENQSDDENIHVEAAEWNVKV